jgi:type III restriction enzyme
VKIKLEDFQNDASGKLIKFMRLALAQKAQGMASAVVLSAPTGSGKTVIATNVIEKTFFGDEDLAPDPNAVFLWITDQPELNLQTQAKMLTNSTKLGQDRLKVIEPTFCEEKLLPGHVYFINTQKLAEGNLLVRGGDMQEITFWQTVANTIADETIHFYAVIDEAHRGMVQDADRLLATTIVQKFIKGTAECPPVPIVVGISATAERFNRLTGATGRMILPVTVSPDEVRASGLIKDRIIALCTNDDGPADITMLREATRAWRKYGEGWAAYSYGSEEEMVRPIMLVQVEDGNEKVISGTNLERVVQAIRDEAGIDLPDEAFAHAFDRDEEIPLGATGALRHLQPSAIDADPDVQVVLFKTSLNVGWDCPRAETMMSFRRATDPTNIAQLVGRMVRTPLARRVKENDHLNSVALYLPYYKKENVAAIVTYLTESGEAAAGSSIETSEPVSLSRAPGTEEIFAALGNITNHTMPRTRKITQVRRLVRLARQLGIDEIEVDAEDREKAALVAILAAERERLKDDEKFKSLIEQRGQLVMRQVEWQVYSPDVDDQPNVTIAVSRENAEDVFHAAGRKLGEGLNVAYFRSRTTTDKIPAVTAKLEVTALAWQPDVITKLEEFARRRVGELFASHAAAIKAVAEASEVEYDNLRGLSDLPEPTPFSPQTVIDVTPQPTSYDHHIYADANGKAPLHLGTWEKAALEAEEKSTGYLGFLRNFDRKPWSLLIPYERNGEPKPMYPDLLIFREGTGEQVLIDMIDPHHIGLEDAVDKAHGLAKYARQYGGEYGRIEIVIEDGSHVLRYLNLQDETIRQQVFTTKTTEHLRALFGA